ncbi:hypothetical protein HME9304_02814 [Flagellimonas maritima]|uniref:BioF2-like acetyltransferase domain-containing protein n=1 Tax=Flagellimonas maritima TaxID=1383885 RepID=A0A2Z4LW92_9FLAO|nr:GNAT family N-acetyltransferase [Allomuricauda aurantiaca]AWX45784.1 hypothetical protein HME9304_02814 [Allomuricauda aurantiaca]
MVRTKTIVFLRNLLVKGNLSPFYTKVTGFNKELYHITPKVCLALQDNLFYIKDVPNYLQVDPPNKLKLRIIRALEGYIIRFDGFSVFKDYLDKNFGAKSKSNFRRYTTRLEKCFNIDYKIYYGNITKDEYERLFKVLRELLIKRFHQKKEANYELQHLDEFKTILFDLIIDKKANLFVIYDDEKPISVRINIHFKRMAYYILSAYDIDYAKFHLGTIEMLKNIKWHYEQNFEAYDLLKGYGYYKKKWMTHTYHCENHIVYDPTSPSAVIFSFLKVVWGRSYYSLVKMLKSVGANKPYKKLKKHLFKIKNPRISQKKVSPIAIDSIHSNETLVIIDIKSDNDYAFLKKSVYDFIFYTQESFNDIRVYKLKKRPSHFLICGKTQKKALVLQ